MNEYFSFDNFLRLWFYYDCAGYIKTKWFQADRYYTVAKFIYRMRTCARTILDFQTFCVRVCAWEGEGLVWWYVGKYQNKAAKIKVMADYQCKFTSKSPRPRDFRTNMQIYTISHEILTSNIFYTCEQVSEFNILYYILILYMYEFNMNVVHFVWMPSKNSICTSVFEATFGRLNLNIVLPLKQ